MNTAVTRRDEMRAAHPEVAALVDHFRPGLVALELRDLDGNLIAGKPIDDTPPPGCFWADADKVIELLEWQRSVSRRR